jgi:hypothetical protein
MSKSTVLLIRCSAVNPDEVLQNFEGDRAALMINYLRLPIIVNKVKMGHLQPVLDCAFLKLSGWQVDLLNLGGRQELVKTDLGSLSTYLLTVIKPPKWFYKEMDKLCRRFLWARSQNLHNGKCKVNW